MKAVMITDKEYQTELFEQLRTRILMFLKNKGFEMEEIGIGREDLAFCMGCFGCWIKKPGECVINDLMTKINQEYIRSDVVIYLSPIIFGHFSANIKNAIDRSLPNVLPFFRSKPDGSTGHPPRYDQYPKEIIVGYQEDLSEEDRQLFWDLTKNHRGKIEVLVCQNSEKIAEELSSIKLETAGGHS